MYYVSNRCTVVCADVDGFANGNDGVQTEKYKDKTDVDIVWEYDMIKELDVFPHNMSAGCPLIVGDMLFIVTANGVDESHINLPSPDAPSFIALNKNTGKLVWKSNVPGKNIMHGQWSNPMYAEIDGVKQVIFPGGDGWLYGFTPDNGRADLEVRRQPEGRRVRARRRRRPQRLHRHARRVRQQDLHRRRPGPGAHQRHRPLLLHRPRRKKGDISKHLEGPKKKNEEGKEVATEQPNPNSCEVWQYGGDDKRQWAPRDFKFGRTMSTACIVDEVVYISEIQGLPPLPRREDRRALLAVRHQGRDLGFAVLRGREGVSGVTSGGDLFVFKHDKKPKAIDATEAAKEAPDRKAARAIHTAKRAETEKEFLVAKVEFPAGIRSTPIVANGVMYVMTENTLYALKTK